MKTVAEWLERLECIGNELVENMETPGEEVFALASELCGIITTILRYRMRELLNRPDWREIVNEMYCLCVLARQLVEQVMFQSAS
jgi:hypothetical protein